MAKIFFLLVGFTAFVSIQNSFKTTTPSPLVVQTTQANTEDFKDIPPFLLKSIEWLAASQASNGGWGAGSLGKSNQKDPNEAVDPATTAFSAMALLRVGNTLDEGAYSKNLKNALDYLLDVVEKCPETAHNITTERGTQPQRKLGGNIDVAMTSQFFGQLEPTIKDKTVTERVHKAWDKCVKILENAQQKDGSWASSGWAPVLNSAMANNALEIAVQSGRAVNQDKLTASRRYQSSNMSAETPVASEVAVGRVAETAVAEPAVLSNRYMSKTRGAVSGVATERSAGVALYSVASTQRATAEQAKAVKSIAKKQKTEAKMDTYEDVYKVLKDEKMSDDEAKDYAKAYMSNNQAAAQMNNEAVLSGFGNNGGEEYLSYMMMSESMVSSGGGKEYDQWYDKMKQRFEKVQNQDHTWSGHHCITSPVFCTAAVILCLTADRNTQKTVLPKKQ